MAQSKSRMAPEGKENQAQGKKRTRSQAFGPDTVKDLTNLIKENGNSEDRALILKKMPFVAELIKPGSILKDFKLTKTNEKITLLLTMPS